MSTLIDLSKNISLMLALTFIYGFIDLRLARLARRVQETIQGVVFGGFAVISMTMPVQVTAGLFYDARTIVICCAGIYGGVIPAVIAAVMVMVYRISIGGIGTPGALASATVAALIGIGLHEYFGQRKASPSVLILLVTGLVLALVGMTFAAVVTGLGLSIAQTSFPTTIILFPIGVLLLGTLISQQRRRQEVETALRDSEQRFHAVFDSAFEFMGLMKPDGTLVEVNQSALMLGGTPPDDLIGVPIWDTTLGRDTVERREEIKAAIARAASGEIVSGEIHLADTQPGAVVLDFSIKPMRDASGAVVLLIAEARDITARKELEQQKIDLVLERERSRLLKKFISDVSHDLRTPLAVIRLNLELLRRTLDSPQHQQRVEILASQEQHLTRLLTDMMTMLTLDEQSNFQFKPLDLNEIAQLAIDNQHGAMQNKQQTLTFNHPDEALFVQGDQVELERALSKLLINAVNYTPKGGAISLSLLREADRAVIELRDTGIGISPDDLPNIFQRFFRADRARSLDTGGTGLGLPIARRIVEAHGGQIEVESVLDAGSCFRISLPYSHDGQAVEAASQNASG
ncbi:MAG: ATP-binding protein [Anaerolineae bacterium]